jgi:hypothetical protein
MKDYEIKAITKNGDIIYYTKLVLSLLMTDDFIIEIYDHKNKKLK